MQKEVLIYLAFFSSEHFERNRALDVAGRDPVEMKKNVEK